MDDEITFIHAADLHLDSPFKGMANVPESIFQQIKNSTFAALHQLVDAAIRKKVDFVLLAGDLFDNEKQSLKAQVQLKTALGRLNKHGINVYLSYGNHDYINGNKHPVTYPENVFVFPDEQVRSFPYEKNGKELARIYGFSYTEREVTENKAAAYELESEEVPFHIAMLHGSVAGNKEHDVYAPFERRQLIKKGFDYWALGHIHRRRIIHDAQPAIVYPGNIQGRHRKETGAKGCYHVRLTKRECELTFVPLQTILFNTISVDLTDCAQIHDALTLISEKMQAIAGDLPQLIDLHLSSNNRKLLQWETEQLLDEAVDALNDMQINRKNWQYIFNLSTEAVTGAQDSYFMEGDHFLGELFREFETTEISPFLEDLYNHRQGRKVLEAPSQAEREHIKEKAKQLLMNQLVKGWQE